MKLIKTRNPTNMGNMTYGLCDKYWFECDKNLMMNMQNNR